MSSTMGTHAWTRVEHPAAPGASATLRAEWVKFWTVRSSPWSLGAMFVLGAGLTTLVCALSAEALARGDVGEPVGAFVTWGMMFAQVTAVVLGALVVTSEYGTGMIRATLAATPRRGAVLAAKVAVLASTLFVAGTLTALVGYLGGNFFLDREGIGMALEGDVLRAMYGSGLYLAGIGLFTVAVGFLLRHTAGTISIVLALMLILGNMVNLVPGAFGEWLVKLMPGNAGSAVSTPVSFNPNLLGPWEGYGVFLIETAVLLGLAWFMVRRRDA
jgi:ABC-2 type transport system permease protein